MLCLSSPKCMRALLCCSFPQHRESKFFAFALFHLIISSPPAWYCFLIGPYFYLSCIYTEGVWPLFANICTVQSFTQKHVCTYSVELLSSLSSSSLFLISLHTHTFIQAHAAFSFWSDSSGELWQIYFSLSSPYFTSVISFFFFFLSFFLTSCFFPLSSSGLSITQQRLRSCHLNV